MSEAPIGVQRRLVELGRIRLGEKGTKGEPRKLTKFRLTSASRPLLEAAARVYGGTVRAWQGAPDDGFWELYSDTDALDVMVPPMLSAYSQYYEVWDAGGCTLRCDGRWESIAGEACSHGDHADMKVTTRVSVILPKLPGLGVWRLETHGWNAASTLPSSLDLIGAAGRWIPAMIRLEQRSSRTRVNGKAMTRRFVVPVIDLVGVSFGDMLAMGETSDRYEAPGLPGVATKALPAPTGPSRPPASTRVTRPELADEPPLEDEASPFSAPVEAPFPEETAAPDPVEEVTAVSFATAIRVAAAACDLEGAATPEQIARLRTAFEGSDRRAIAQGLTALWNGTAVGHPTAAQAEALVRVADSMGPEAFRDAWSLIVEHEAVPA